MRIPKKLKVGGIVYSVDPSYTFTERNDLFGQSDHGVHTIRISKVSEALLRPRDAIERTLWHEILHCIDHVFNANKMEEDEVKRISHGIYQVLRDNRLY